MVDLKTKLYKWCANSVFRMNLLIFQFGENVLIQENWNCRNHFYFKRYKFLACDDRLSRTFVLKTQLKTAKKPKDVVALYHYVNYHWEDSELDHLMTVRPPHPTPAAWQRRRQAADITRQAGARGTPLPKPFGIRNKVTAYHATVKMWLW